MSLTPQGDGAAESNDRAAARSEAMPAEFGLPMAVCVVVASMVGTGVLMTSGYTVASVGSNQYMLILWVVGGVTAVCGALTVAELSASMPRTGGDYVFLYEAYGPLAAFLTGWASFLMGFSGPSAAAAFGSAKYVLAPLQLPEGQAVLLQRLLASLAILAFAAAIVGGITSIPGAVVGGFIIGVAENLVGLFVSTNAIVVAPFLAILIVLIVRPQGILGGKAQVKKV